MLCPFCQTDNREDRELCYACDKDLSMLRLISNKARHHYNVALEHAERGRNTEAIDELKNALDLDRRFIPARVVLGTIQAREGLLDEARESWTAALGAHPDLSKAHNYLQRVETVEASLPEIGRLRAGMALLAALLAMVAVALGLVLREPAAGALTAANQSIAAGDYGRALENLAVARSASRGGTAIHAAASTLENSLRSELRQQVARIQDLKYSENYPAVLTALADLESSHPDVLTRASLASIREDVANYFLKSVKAAHERYETGRAPYAEFIDRAREFQRLYPNLRSQPELTRLMDQARETEAARRFDQALAEFGPEADSHTEDSIAKALRDLRDAAAAFPKSSAAATQGRSRLVEAVFTALFQRSAVLQEEGDFDGAGEVLDTVAGLSEEFRDVVDVSGPVQEATRVLAGSRRQARLRAAEDLARRGPLEDAWVELEDLATDDTATTAERDLVASLGRVADVREARRELDKSRAIGQAVLAGREFSETELARLGRTWTELSERLTAPSGMAGTPGSTEARADALAYAAAAAARRGEREAAQRLAAAARETNELDPKVAGPLQALMSKKPGAAARPSPRIQVVPSRDGRP